MPLKKVSERASEAVLEPQLQSVEQWLGQLCDEDVVKRRDAARALLTTGCPASALVERLWVEPQLSVREALFTTLAHMADETALKGLVGCLTSEDTCLRNEAIAALKQVTPLLEPYLRPVLESPDADLRIFAFNVLSTPKNADHLAWVEPFIRAEENVNVCAAALEMLVEVGDCTLTSLIGELKTRFFDEDYIQFLTGIVLRRCEGAV